MNLEFSIPDGSSAGLTGMKLLDLTEFTLNGFQPGFSAWVNVPQRTPDENVYFTTPGIAMLSKPSFSLLAASPFFKQFDEMAGPEDQPFLDYLNDQTIEHGAALAKFAGQLCYLALGDKRTKNANAQKYFENILSQKHGSILEHAQFSMLFWGINRSLTHELVRHRAGFAYSQVSQRYVNGTRLRFVMRPEYLGCPELENHFCQWVDNVVVEYDDRAELLMKHMGAQLEKLSPTDRRKAVNQAARACLPNETEAPIVVSANVRAWRHFLTMRGALAAEPEVRMLALRVLVALYYTSPMLFGDFGVYQDEESGRIFLRTDYEKV